MHEEANGVRERHSRPPKNASGRCKSVVKKNPAQAGFFYWGALICVRIFKFNSAFAAAFNAAIAESSNQRSNRRRNRRRNRINRGWPLRSIAAR